MRTKQLLIIAVAMLMASASSSRAEDIPGLGTPADIFKPQFEALSFRHMEALFPSRKIARSGDVSKLPLAPKQLSDVPYKYKGDRTLLDFLKRSHTTSFVAIKDGRVAMERYFDGASPASTFTSWSVGKSFTSTLVGLALADGKISSIDDPITKYIPELKGSGYDGVQIKDVLQMSTGVKFVEEYKDTPESDVSRMWA
ncbi:MAG TPA: serine hydrolase, partial [Candidatus Binataceae bacterium]|nr:serine hydrolase [Candidatus Binataceae bacterium]